MPPSSEELRTITPQTRMSGFGIVTVGRINELKEIGENKTVINFSVCFNDIVTRQDAKEKIPVWIDCELWGRQAKKFASMVKTGDFINIETRLMAPRYFEYKGQARVNLRVSVRFFSIVKSSPRATGAP